MHMWYRYPVPPRPMSQIMSHRPRPHPPMSLKNQRHFHVSHTLRSTFTTIRAPLASSSQYCNFRCGNLRPQGLSYKRIVRRTLKVLQSLSILGRLGPGNLDLASIWSWCTQVCLCIDQLLAELLRTLFDRLESNIDV